MITFEEWYSEQLGGAQDWLEIRQVSEYSWNAALALANDYKWVSVLTDLPPEDKDVLLWCGWHITGKYRKNKGFITEDGQASVQMVTHWCNLPQPPTKA